ncbi:MAG: type II toxin-antitoxin system RelE/ParE family toxin [Saprospiraceae bacterium]|nr:type II toxin-antitoxin system RelE/ParE family toxin [Saprospiraceae bacterium]
MAEKVIVWKEKPAAQLRELLEFLEKEFSVSAAEKLLKQLEEKFARIKRYPESGHSTPYKTVRRVRAGQHLNIFYRMHGSKIFIVFLFDGRQHPDKNPYRKK